MASEADASELAADALLELFSLALRPADLIDGAVQSALPSETLQVEGVDCSLLLDYVPGQWSYNFVCGVIGQSELSALLFLDEGVSDSLPFLPGLFLSQLHSGYLWLFFNLQF